MTGIEKTTSTRSSGLSLNPYAIVVGESQERVEQERRKGKWSTPSNLPAMVRYRESERVTHKYTSAQTTCRVPQPRCTKCTKTSPGFLAVRLSPREPKKCYGRIGTSIQEFKHEEPKDKKRHGLHFPLIRSPKQRRESRDWKQNINKQKGAQSTSYWIDGD